MIVHHIATFWGSLYAIWLPYYPWFLTSILATHCYLIKWPYNKILHIPYTIALLYFLSRLFTRPFFKVKQFRGILKSLPLLTVGLLTFSFNGCDTNDLKY